MKNTKQFNYLNDKDPWMLAEDIPDIDFSFSHIWLNCFANNFKHPSGKAYKKVLAVYRGYHLWFYYGEQDSYNVAQNIVSRFLANPAFAANLNKDIVKEADKLTTVANQLPETNLQKYTNKQLWDIYSKYHTTHSHYYQWCWIPVAVDMFHNNLTKTLKDYLKEKNVSEEKLNEYFTLLTQPINKSLIQQEKEEFLQLAAHIQKDPHHSKLFKNFFALFEEQEAGPFGLATHTPAYESLLEKKMDSIREKIRMGVYKKIHEHYVKYHYVKYMWLGLEGVHSFNSYLKEFVKFIGKESNAEKLLKEKREEQSTIAKKKGLLLKKLAIEKKYKTLFEAFGDFMVTKIYRRYAQIYAVYRVQPIIEEIARRLELEDKEVRFMLPEEIKNALLHQVVERSEIKKRTKFCVYYVEEGQEKIFTGKKAEMLANSLEVKNVEGITELKGEVGCVGKAVGVVKIITRPSDMHKMKKGDILVSIATDPDIVPAMAKAAAIVTEQGGVTSHAAIVSRELNIPCVIGTKIAMKVFKDGDYVEVDAINGVVMKK